MDVSALIKQLQTLPQDSEVLCQDDYADYRHIDTIETNVLYADGHVYLDMQSIEYMEQYTGHTKWEEERREQAAKLRQNPVTAVVLILD